MSQPSQQIISESDQLLNSQNSISQLDKYILQYNNEKSMISTLSKREYSQINTIEAQYKHPQLSNSITYLPDIGVRDKQNPFVPHTEVSGIHNNIIDRLKQKAQKSQLYQNNQNSNINSSSIYLDNNNVSFFNSKILDSTSLANLSQNNISALSPIKKPSQHQTNSNNTLKNSPKTTAFHFSSINNTGNNFQSYQSLHLSQNSKNTHYKNNNNTNILTSNSTTTGMFTANSFNLSRNKSMNLYPQQKTHTLFSSQNQKPKRHHKRKSVKSFEHELIQMKLQHNRGQQEFTERQDFNKLKIDYKEAKEQNLKIIDQLSKMNNVKKYPSQGLTNYACNTDNVQTQLAFDTYMDNYKKQKNLEMVKHRETLQKNKKNPLQPNQFQQKLQDKNEQKVSNLFSTGNTDLSKTNNSQQQKPQQQQPQSLENSQQQQKKKKKHIKFSQHIGDTIYAYWIDKEQQQYMQQWVPPSRQLAAGAQINEYTYIYGGCTNSQVRQNELYCFNTNELRWGKMVLRNVDNKEDVSDQFLRGHTMNAYYQNLIIFGGEKYESEDKSLKQISQCSNVLKIINLQRAEIKMIENRNINIEGRKNHCAQVFKNQLYFVLGGINSYQKFLSDFWEYNLKKKQWDKIPIVFEDEKDNNYFKRGIAYHTCVSGKSRWNGAIQRLKQSVKQDTDKIKRHIDNSRAIIQQEQQEHEQIIDKFEGLYFYGGMSQDRTYLYGDLLFLQINYEKNQYVWNRLKPKGTPPQPRFGHSMTFSNEQSYIVIYGGRGKNDQFLQDIFLYKLEDQEWVNVIISDKLHTSRVEHLAYTWQNQLFVFGGFNDTEGILSNQADILELNDSLNAQHRMKQKLKTASMDMSKSNNSLQNLGKPQILKKNNLVHNQLLQTNYYMQNVLKTFNLSPLKKTKKLSHHIFEQSNQQQKEKQQEQQETTDNDDDDNNNKVVMALKKLKSQHVASSDNNNELQLTNYNSTNKTGRQQYKSARYNYNNTLQKKKSISLSPIKIEQQQKSSDQIQEQNLEQYNNGMQVSQKSKQKSILKNQSKQLYSGNN